MEVVEGVVLILHRFITARNGLQQVVEGVPFTGLLYGFTCCSQGAFKGCHSMFARL